MRCSEAGAPTSATVSHRERSPTYATTPTGEWSAGCAADTANGTGAGCAAPTSRRRWPSHAGVELFNPVSVRIERYRYRGARIPLPWTRGVIAVRDDDATINERLQGLIVR